MFLLTLPDYRQYNSLPRDEAGRFRWADKRCPTLLKISSEIEDPFHGRVFALLFYQKSKSDKSKYNASVVIRVLKAPPNSSEALECTLIREYIKGNYACALPHPETGLLPYPFLPFPTQDPCLWVTYSFYVPAHQGGVKLG